MNVPRCLPECTYCHPTDVLCDHCGNLIPRAVEHRNLDGGMRVSVEGWYGGTIDTFRPPVFTLCHVCATALAQGVVVTTLLGAVAGWWRGRQ